MYPDLILNLRVDVDESQQSDEPRGITQSIHLILHTYIHTYINLYAYCN